VYLRQTSIELIRPDIERGRFRYVLFDFDGTISLIREGWQQVMVEMMTRTLASTPQAEETGSIQSLVEQYVARSTGMQTVYQMIWLADEVSDRGGKALEPLVYKDMYNEMLLARIQQRIEDLRTGRTQPEEWMVPGSRQLLENLRQRGCTLFCASGTDHEYMTREAELLGVAKYFNGGLHGAINDYKNFSKKILIDRIIADNQLAGSELLAFGDGYVEIEDTKGALGVAVGVASDETGGGEVNAAKRTRLIEAGADVIVPDFREQEALVAWLFESDSSR
jgi:phosphoglycolate phosphatase-like HAD superfamily hydrolase